MRGRDVEQMLRKYGHERGTMHVLLRLAEETEFLAKNMREMAGAIEALANVVTMQNTVADNMKDKIDGMASHFDVDPRSTHAIVRSMDPEDE
jgi:hypothetical protein